MSQMPTGVPAGVPPRPRTSLSARSLPVTKICTESRLSNISDVIPLKSMEPTTSKRNPEMSEPTNESGSIPFRKRSPVAFSSTHQTNSSESTSKPPASERRIRTSCDSASRTEAGRGFETSTGIGPVPSTIIQRTDVSWSVASTPCPCRQPTLQVSGIVMVVEGACKATDQIPSSELAEVVEPANKTSIWQSKSGVSPVSAKTTSPAISKGLFGAKRAPSPNNVPCERIKVTVSSGISIAAENRQRCSGKVWKTSCPALSITRIPGSLRVSPKSGVVHANFSSTLSVMSRS